MDKRPIEKILQNQVLSIKPFRRHWVIYTADRRKWQLKVMESSSHLKWWCALDKELRARGFVSMPPVYTDGARYLLTPWIQGNVCQYQNPVQSVQIIKQLARFHQAGRGLLTPPKQEVAFLLYDRLYERLKRFYHLMKQVKQIQGEFGQLLAEVGPQFYRDGWEAWEQLIRLPLRDFTLWQRKNHYLAHRDLASHNWLWDRNNRIWLIDFDTAEYDSQLGDLWQILGRMAAEQQWDPSALQRLLAGYESICPLSAFERKLLLILLRFPNEFFREAIGLYLKKTGYTSPSTLAYLQKLAQGRIRWLRQVQQGLRSW